MTILLPAVPECSRVDSGGNCMNLRCLIQEFISDESGQGITEYGAILAFVALLVAVVFSFASGTLTSAISQSFSSIVKQMNNMTSLTSRN